MDNPRLTHIKAGILSGRRPRNAGCNSRLPSHGIEVRESFVRLRFEDGSGGFGSSSLKAEQAHLLLGQPLSALISRENGVSLTGRPIEFPLWDVLGQRAKQPVYRLIAVNEISEPYSVPCYATGLYFDDLHLSDQDEAVQYIVDEALADYQRGQRAFKLKVGRGAMHMPLIEGTQRDIAVIRGVRAAVGDGLPLMIDANNGYNVNLVKWVLKETADCQLYWLEEPFHEDPVLYRHLRGWMKDHNLTVLIADGEGYAAPRLVEWASDGVIDVVQYDLREIGLSAWLNLGVTLDAAGVKSAPHNYGSAFGNFASCHLPSALKNFTFVEWDQIDLVGLDTSDYSIREGRVNVPDAPGFGLHLDESIFAQAVAETGFSVG
ncbi:MAG: mandelate racemase [Chloroflexi bacterium]|nr:mandelate racemase [Chloroflexota bacterium]